MVLRACTWHEQVDVLGVIAGAFTEQLRTMLALRNLRDKLMDSFQQLRIACMVRILFRPHCHVGDPVTVLYEHRIERQNRWWLSASAKCTTHEVVAHARGSSAVLVSAGEISTWSS